MKASAKTGLLAAFILSMRPKQWSKNLLVFMALFFTVDQAWGPLRYRDRRTPIHEDCRSISALLRPQRRRVHRQRPDGSRRGPAASEETPPAHRIRQAADTPGEGRRRRHRRPCPRGFLLPRTALRTHHAGLSGGNAALLVRPQESGAHRRVRHQRRIHTPGRRRRGRDRFTDIALALHLHRSRSRLRRALQETKRTGRRGRSGPRAARDSESLQPFPPRPTHHGGRPPQRSCPTPSTP